MMLRSGSVTISCSSWQPAIHQFTKRVATTGLQTGKRYAKSSHQLEHASSSLDHLRHSTQCSSNFCVTTCIHCSQLQDGQQAQHAMTTLHALTMPFLPGLRQAQLEVLVNFRQTSCTRCRCLCMAVSRASQCSHVNHSRREAAGISLWWPHLCAKGSHPCMIACHISY